MQIAIGQWRGFVHLWSMGEPSEAETVCALQFYSKNLNSNNLEIKF